jgi:urease accessory protein
MIAQLQLQTQCINGITRLQNCYTATPFKVANITEDKKDHMLRLMLMSSSPGILDGDAYDITIELEQNCSLQLHTQSYQRLFTMKLGATQNTTVHLSKGAAFSYIPHPAVPHQQSSFTSRNTIHLSEDCRLLWGEILTCGRKLNGEVFQLSSYHSKTDIYLHQKLVIKENLLLQPVNMDINALGQLQGFTHQASLIFLHPSAVIKNILPQVMEILSVQEGVHFGVSITPVNGLMVRMLGQKAEQLFDCLKTIAGILPVHQENPTAYAI